MGKYIVVGAGILGASTAYHLAKAGADVTIVDRKDIGQATEAAAGIVCPWLAQRRNQKWYRLVKGGAKYYPALIAELEEAGETDTGYRRVGAISLQRDEEKLKKAIERVTKRKEDGAPEIGEITHLSADETKQRFPAVAEGYESIHVSGAARVDGRKLRDALLRTAEKNGADFVQGDATLIHEGKNVTGVKVNGEMIEGDVLVTGGAWSKELLTPLGIEFLVSPQKAQIVHLDVSGENTDEWPVVMPPNNQYLLAFEGGRVVIGATHEREAGFDNRPTAGGLHYIFDKALEMFPGLKDSTFVETRVGFRPFTPGSLPVFGAIPETNGLYVANGLGASGLTSGPYLGAELAKLVMGEETELDPAEFDVNEAIE